MHVHEQCVRNGLFWWTHWHMWQCVYHLWWIKFQLIAMWTIRYQHNWSVDLVVCAVIGWGSKLPGAHLGHSIIVFEWMAACQVVTAIFSCKNFLWFLSKMTQVLLPSPLRFGRRSSCQSKVSFMTKILTFSSFKKLRNTRDNGRGSSVQ